jgi:hypothetical protein
MNKPLSELIAIASLSAAALIACYLPSDAELNPSGFSTALRVIKTAETVKQHLSSASVVRGALA